MAIQFAAYEVVLIGLLAHLVIYKLFGSGVYTAIARKVERWFDDNVGDSCSTESRRKNRL